MHQKIKAFKNNKNLNLSQINVKNYKKNKTHQKIQLSIKKKVLIIIAVAY